MSECELCGAPLYSDAPGFCGHCKELEEQAEAEGDWIADEMKVPMRDTYDKIRLASNEWGSPLMREIAQAHFAGHPDCRFVLVHEHGGWWLGYRRDLTIWCSANDAAVLDGGPRPLGASGIVVQREIH